VAVSDGAIYAFLPFVVVIALGIGLGVVFWQRVSTRRALAGRRIVEADLGAPPRDAPARPVRPWWGNAWVWLLVCGVFVVLGLFVWPGLFGGTFLFLPFVWVWRPRRVPTVDPRTNGHSRRGDTGSFTGT
jgi:uncharacterized membrane protein YphA (DoxX/SURF4 family)